jgi:hypothetical protein
MPGMTVAVVGGPHVGKTWTWLSLAFTLTRHDGLVTLEEGPARRVLPVAALSRHYPPGREDSPGPHGPRRLRVVATGRGGAPQVLWLLDGPGLVEEVGDPAEGALLAAYLEQALGAQLWVHVVTKTSRMAPVDRALAQVAQGRCIPRVVVSLSGRRKAVPTASSLWAWWPLRRAVREVRLHLSCEGKGQVRLGR